MIVRAETLFRDVIEAAAVRAKGRGMMLSSGGDRDVLGEAFHAIGVADHSMRDSVKTADLLLSLGVLSAWIRAGVAWDRGDKREALQLLKVWADVRTVRQVRALFPTSVELLPLEEGVPLA